MLSFSRIFISHPCVHMYVCNIVYLVLTCFNLCVCLNGCVNAFFVWLGVCVFVHMYRTPTYTRECNVVTFLPLPTNHNSMQHLKNTQIKISYNKLLTEVQLPTQRKKVNSDYSIVCVCVRACVRACRCWLSSLCKCRH